MRRLGSYQTITVAADPDVSDSAAQRKIVTSDAYSVSGTSPAYGQANVWVGRSGDGARIKANSYVKLARAILVPPSSNLGYTLRIYGYGTTGTLVPLSTAAAVQATIRAVSASSLGSVTVTGSVGGPFTIAGLPSSDTTIELVRADATDATGSVTQGLCSFEVIRPFSVAPGFGDEVELLYKYPAHDADLGLVGMNRLIDQAMNRLWFVDLLQFHSTDAESDQQVFSTAAYPWLRTRPQVIRAYAPCTWEHTFSYTVPVGAHTLSLDLGMAAVSTTASLAGSASAAVIQTALQALITTDNGTGTVSVTEDGTTRTVVVSMTYFASMALTVSTGAAVTIARERLEPLRFTDGWRLKFHGAELFVEWDGPWTKGYTWFLEVYRPANTWIAPQAAYGTTSEAYAAATGFTDDYDQCILDADEVASVAHYLACRQLELAGPGQERQYWHDEARRAALIASEIKSLDLPSSRDPGFRSDGLVATRALIDKGFFSTSGFR
jgi:hypothetical protein